MRPESLHVSRSLDVVKPLNAILSNEGEISQFLPLCFRRNTRIALSRSEVGSPENHGSVLFLVSPHQSAIIVNFKNMSHVTELSEKHEEKQLDNKKKLTANVSHICSHLSYGINGNGFSHS